MIVEHRYELEHIGLWLLFGSWLFSSSICMAQVSEIDTTWDKHGRVSSIWYQATGDRITYSHDRSGRLTMKGVETGLNGVRLLIDTTWNSKGQLSSVTNWNSGDMILYSYDRKDRLVRKKTYTTLGGQQYNEVTDYFPMGGISAHYYEAVDSKRFMGIVRRDSISTLYCPDSTVKSVARYDQGKLDGVSIDYYWSGVVESIEVYSQGRLMSVQYFDQDGSELSNGDFTNGSGTLAIHHNGIQTRTCLYKDGYLVKKSCKCP